MRLLNVLIFLLAIQVSLIAQPDRWQQKAEYKMEIDFDVNKHQFTGTQSLVYYNNSPEYIDKVFYHLYFNAFQPGSMMDIRSNELPDSDPRVGARISKLKDNEIGYHKIKSLTMDGEKVSYEVVGTILEVTLNKAIRPNSKVTFDMEFEGQVPLQIRRSGRNNKEGIDYSMSQWYPKMCEYDYQGWHANPYVGREFYGIWGDFDVKISIDKNYIIGGSGYLQNPQTIGYGYEEAGQTVNRPSGDKLTWHFVAPNVHDFVWAADPDYTHTKLKADNGVMMHFFFQKNDRTSDIWARLPDVMNQVFTFADRKYGKYPYKQYSFIQAGDGGMEYPMATLITGERSFGSLVGVSVHELMHSWYQMVLGTNEALYAWMDEGFTSYASAEIMNFLKSKNMLPGSKPVADPHRSSYIGYSNISQSGNEEALITHADHFSTNNAYGVASYVKGAVFLHQLQYIVGKQKFDQGMLDYYNTWKFKHPNTNDFIRIMEKVSGLELDWYREYFVNTIHTIDYGVKSVKKQKRKSTKIVLERKGKMPMPIDVLVTEENGNQTIYHIPLRIMRGEKEKEIEGIDYEVKEDWPWTHPTYEFTIPKKHKKIKSVVIDPTGRLADVNPNNNVHDK